MRATYNGQLACILLSLCKSGLQVVGRDSSLVGDTAYGSILRSLLNSLVSCEIDSGTGSVKNLIPVTSVNGFSRASIQSQAEVTRRSAVKRHKS